MTTGYKPKRITSKEDRGSRNGFIQLKKTGDTVFAYALFVPDPEVDDNPGYFEYPEHFNQELGYFPCPGEEDCPICEEGQNPSTRAKSAWLVVDKDDFDPTAGEVKIFNLNWYMIDDLSSLLEEDEPVQGQLFRIRKQEGNGRYGFTVKSSKLNATQIKKGKKEVPDIEKMLTAQLNKKMEQIGLTAAMEENDDDDDDDEKKTSSRKGTEAKSSTKSTKSSTKKTAKAEPDDDPEFDPENESEFEGVATIVKINKGNNIATVTVGDATFDIYGTDDCDLRGFKKNDEVRFSATKDDDDDFVAADAQADDAEPEPDDDDDDDGKTVGELNGKVTITEVNSDEDTWTVEDSDGNSHELFFPAGEDDNGNDWSDFDLGDFEEGDVVTVEAEIDDDDDLVMQQFPVKADQKKKSGRK